MMNFKNRMLISAGLGLFMLTSNALGGVSLGVGGKVADPSVFALYGAGPFGPAFSTSLPTWAGGAGSLLAATMTKPMTGDFTGTATSEVWYLNGVDGTGGLGFTYQFFVTGTTNPVGNGLIRASFNSDPPWEGTIISDVGSNGAGSSSLALNAPTWTDGDPFQITRTSAGTPAIAFSVGEAGTQIKGGDYSAVVFFETDATTWQQSDTGLQDSGNVGEVEIFAVPAPAGALLGVIGLATIGWVRRRMA